MNRPPRRESPFPATIPPRQPQPDTGYSKVDPARRREFAQQELIERLERALAEAETARSERRPVVDTAPAPTVPDRISIKVSPQAAAAFVLALIAGAAGFKALIEVEDRAEKPTVQTHVRDLYREMDASMERVRVLEQANTKMKARLEERDCWWLGVIQMVDPSLAIRLPEGFSCADIEVRESLVRKNAMPVKEVLDEYPR